MYIYNEMAMSLTYVPCILNNDINKNTLMAIEEEDKRIGGYESMRGDNRGA